MNRGRGSRAGLIDFSNRTETGDRSRILVANSGVNGLQERLVVRFRLRRGNLAIAIMEKKERAPPENLLVRRDPPGMEI